MKSGKVTSFFIAVFLLTCANVAGQEVKVKGMIVDSLSGNPEVAAIVQFYKSEDSTKPVAYTTTGTSGEFTHMLADKGRYRLLLHNLGKKDKSVEFTVDDRLEIDLGKITVQDDVTTLKAGSVTALSRLVEIDADKITYKVQNDTDAKAKTVIDILRKVPLVSVDPSGKIFINGSNSFIVYYDGKKNQMMSDRPTEIFSAMPASMIQNIEVITEPGARYDAEGVGAVLNMTSIAAAHDDSGNDFYNTNVSLGGSTRRFYGSLFYSVMKDKWTVSMSLSGLRGWSGQNDIYRERLSETDSGPMKMTSTGISKGVSSSAMGDFSASYEIDKYNLLSLSAGISDINISDGELMSTAIDVASQKYEYGENEYYKYRTDRINANLDYQHLSKNKPGRVFVMSYQVSANPSRRMTESVYSHINTLPSNLNDRKYNGLSNSTTHSVQADYETPIAKGHKFSTGAKIMMRHNKSDYETQILHGDTYVPVEAEGVDYNFFNNIGALYAEYDGRLKSFKYRAGLRYEHTWQKADYNNFESKDFKLDYGNLVPSARIQYSINDMQNVGLTYSMNIRRPGITYLNPYVDLSDPTSKTYGNPDLKAETGHQMQLAYNLFSSKWILTMRLRQSFRNNGISSYKFYDESNILNTTYGNIINNSLTALNAYASWSPAQKTNLILNGQVGYNIFKSDKLNLNTEGWTYNLMATVEQVIPADIVLNATVLYLSNSMQIQSTVNGIWEASLSLSRQFLDKKLNVSLRAANTLSKYCGKAAMTTSHFGADFTSKDQILMPWRDVFLNLSYTFGNKDGIQVKKSRKKASISDQIDMDHTEK